jgi:hypothetical protein
MRFSVPRKLRAGLLVAAACGIGLCVVAGVGGWWWLRRTIARGNALNAPPPAIAATRPAVPFDGHVDLVRGGTLRLTAVGTNDPRNARWWTPDGTPTTRPKHADEHRDLPVSLGPVSLGPPGRVRVLAWSLAERSAADRNVRPSLAVPGTLAHVDYNDDADYDFGTRFYTHFGRFVFQRPDDAATFTARGEIDDHQWQTFAVVTPGGPTQFGPIAAAFSSGTNGRATLTLKGDWAWPMRVVFETHGGEASEGRLAFGMKTPLGRSHEAVSGVFKGSDIKAAYVQLCGQQRFEVRGLPSDPPAPGATTRRATPTLVVEHLHPAVPGLTPLAAAPPPEIPPLRLHALLAAMDTATTIPATMPSTTPTGTN